MEKMSLSPVGKIAVRDGETGIELNKEFCPALKGLDGFGYIQVLWWFDGCDNEIARTKLTETSPYKKRTLRTGNLCHALPGTAKSYCAFLCVCHLYRC